MKTPIYTGAPPPAMASAMTEAQIWGRRVMLAVLSLVVVIPLVNMRLLIKGGVPGPPGGYLVIRPTNKLG